MPSLWGLDCPRFAPESMEAPGVGRGGRAVDSGHDYDDRVLTQSEAGYGTDFLPAYVGMGPTFPCGTVHVKIGGQFRGWSGIDTG